ncbi:hypothetical protein TEQG_05115 [Trichophyton equinum CBS 127.97]|uniref:Uncharacterized protein n=1 Tax=Trichophyton equinum (strain ATCC MYA-4606 / CBS 127.97) TaxID=559882 RepID=F2PWF1_TRIEC|nr:hypothetical protein TEQG_05115 [Trichophyton equinum CBS 127.97]
MTSVTSTIHRCYMVVSGWRRWLARSVPRPTETTCYHAALGCYCSVTTCKEGENYRRRTVWVEIADAHPYCKRQAGLPAPAWRLLLEADGNREIQRYRDDRRREGGKEKENRHDRPGRIRRAKTSSQVTLEADGWEMTIILRLCALRPFTPDTPSSYRTSTIEASKQASNSIDQNKGAAEGPKKGLRK